MTPQECVCASTTSEGLQKAVALSLFSVAWVLCYLHFFFHKKIAYCDVSDGRKLLV